MLATDVRELSHNGNSVRGADASLVAHGDSGTDTDEVLKALGELDDVLKENAERERVLGLAQIEAADAADEQVGNSEIEEAP